MANNLLALPGIGAGAPLEAEYDAVYAAVTATERGRWFLTEFASRNRHADTGSLVAALARIEAALATDARSHHSIATADLGAAAEKIADIAFGLRERGADQALCDALDAAVRHLGAASGNGAGGLESAYRAGSPEPGEATLPGGTRPVAADRIGEPADETDKSPGFEFELQDRKKFAAAATALAASLGALDGQSVEKTPTTPAADRIGEPVGEADRSPDFEFELQERENFAAAAAAFAASLGEFDGLSGEETPATPAAEQLPTVAVILPHDYIVASALEPQPEPVANAPGSYIEAPDFVFRPAVQQTNGHAAVSSDDAGALPPLRPRPRRLANPQDDPAELFEPVSNSAALRTADLVPAVPAKVTKIAAAPEPAAPPVPRPVAVSPLAALHALSEDELLALFG